MNHSIQLLLFLCFALTNLCFADSELRDSYADIDRFVLKNGLTVFLMPIPRAPMARLKLSVRVGQEMEDSTNYGVSHLLEHLMFRDESLPSDLTFSEFIQEKGGYFNAKTLGRVTVYTADAKTKDLDWLIDQVHKMTFNKRFKPEWIELEKSAILIERGPIGNSVALVGPWIKYIYDPPYLERPNAWNIQFDVNQPKLPDRDIELVSTQSLIPRQIEDHYKKFYQPGNMVLYVAGDFDKNELRSKLERSWAVIPSTFDKKLVIEPEAIPRQTPYVNASVRPGFPGSIAFGAQVWNLTQREYLILDSYLNYAAFRLMKDLRNDFGKTYSVSRDISLKRNYGFAVIELDTTAAHLDSSLTKVRQLIHDDVYGGKLDAERIGSAKSLYISDTMTWDGSPGHIISFAEDIEFSSRRFGESASPYAVLNSISTEEYLATLKTMFAPDRMHSVSVRDHLFFKGDFLVLIVLFLSVCWFVLRKQLRGNFSHSQVQYVRKITQPPFWINHVLALFFGWIIFRHLNGAGEYLISTISFLREHIFLNYIMSDFAFCMFIAGSWALVNCAIPNKLMIVGDQLIIKSMSFYAISIPLNEITGVTNISMPFYPLTKFEIIKSVKYRCYFPLVLNPGRLLITRTDGRSYLFAVRSPQVVSAEIKSILEKDQKRNLIIKAA